MIKPDPGSSFEDHSRGLGAGVGDENVESCRIVHPPCIALMIHPVHRSYVVVRKTDELLCGRYKWVSRFEVLYICTWWTGERWVEQMFRLHGTAFWRQCGSIVMKLSRLDACADWKVVLFGWMNQGCGSYLQSCCSSTPTGASKPPQERDAWCQLLVKWLKVSMICERPVQRYSKFFCWEQQVPLLKFASSSHLMSLLLTPWRLDGFGDFCKKNSSFRLPYQRPSSYADCARELFNGSNGSASLVDCTQKIIFAWGVRVFCEWRHKWSSFRVIMAHVAWPRAQPLGQSVSLKF